MVGIGHRPHRRDEPGLFEPVAELHRRILAAAVRVMHEAAHRRSDAAGAKLRLTRSGAAGALSVAPWRVVRIPGQVLAQQPVRVLAGAALPGALRTQK